MTDMEDTGLELLGKECPFNTESLVLLSQALKYFAQNFNE